MCARRRACSPVSRAARSFQPRGTCSASEQQRTWRSRAARTRGEPAVAEARGAPGRERAGRGEVAARGRLLHPAPPPPRFLSWGAREERRDPRSEEGTPRGPPKAPGRWGLGPSSRVCGHASYGALGRAGLPDARGEGTRTPRRGPRDPGRPRPWPCPKALCCAPRLQCPLWPSDRPVPSCPQIFRSILFPLPVKLLTCYSKGLAPPGSAQIPPPPRSPP